MNADKFMDNIMKIVKNEVKKIKKKQNYKWYEGRKYTRSENKI